MTAPVVIVHGLWLQGFEFILLRARLARAGFVPLIFQYRSTRDSLHEVTAALALCVHSFDGPVHLVAHSLGGVIALETFASERNLPPGRIVLLGSPVQGSRAARALAGRSWGPHVLGRLAVAELCRPCNRRWDQNREIGLIAGSLGFGLGRMFANLPPPHDGTVCVDETRLPGATDHIILDVSHTGMLLSSAVSSATVAFLRRGRFDRSP